MRKRTGVLLGLLGAGVGLVAGLPLAWVAAPLPDIGARYSGTWWNGQARGVPLLGQLSVNGGLTGVRLATRSGDVTFQGSLSPRSISDLALAMPIDRLPTTDARLAGLAGQFSLRIDNAKFSSAGCDSAQGTASTDVLAVNAARFSWKGPMLSGPVDCIDGRLRVQLSGEGNGTTVASVTTTGMDGLYQTDTTVSTADPAAGNALVLFGFARSGASEFTLSEQGRWQ